MDGGDNVLRRKLAKKGVGRSPIPDIERLGELISKEIEHALRPILSVQIAAMVMESEVATLATVNESLPAPSLVSVLAFPGASSKAMINFNAELIYHIVDLRMGGDPNTCPMPTTRSITAIDYALCEEAAQETVWAIERGIERVLNGPLGSHFSIKDRAQNVGNVVIAPDTSDVLRFTVSLDIGVAARSGDIDIVLPLAVLDLVRSSVQQERPEMNVAVKDIWLERMRRAVNEAVLPLSAVIARPQVASEKLGKLKVGDVIPIPSNAPQNVILVMHAGKKNSFDVASARLGAFEGKKVLKLNDTPNDAVLRHINGAVNDD